MIHIAHKTLQAIERAIEVDQGARFRTLLRQLVPLAEDAYRGEEFPFRAHLGASTIGEDCGRALWYGFHWAVKPRHSDRILRLFNRGHLEEPRFAAMLGAAGIKLHQYGTDRKQFQIVMHGGHFGGSLDGVAEQIPDVEGPVLCEFKTHDRKSFYKLAGANWLDYQRDPSNNAWQGEGVRASKFRHYVQMQMYMAAYQLNNGLYMAVCKDDDALYGEIIVADAAISNTFANRAADIIFSRTPPARIKNDPTWWQCRFCDKAIVCYNKAEASRNCRTCANSRPTNDGAWQCLLDDRSDLPALTKEQQIAGCPQYSAQQCR